MHSQSLSKRRVSVRTRLNWGIWESRAEEGAGVKGGGEKWGEREVCLDAKTRTVEQTRRGVNESWWMLWRQCCPLAWTQRTQRLTALGNTHTHTHIHSLLHTPVDATYSWDFQQTLLFLSLHIINTHTLRRRVLHWLEWLFEWVLTVKVNE